MVLNRKGKGFMVYLSIEKELKIHEVRNMEEFIKWFLENWNANIFTLFTVLLSGIISLIISAAYYRKGNRNNLKMSVIHPIISILNDSYSRNNYEKMEKISKEYSVRYFKRKELKKLNILLETYKEN